jgi:hypothetical protein
MARKVTNVTSARRAVEDELLRAKCELDVGPGLVEPPCARVGWGCPPGGVNTIADSRRPSRIPLSPVRSDCRGSPAVILGTGGRKRPNQRIAAGVLGTAVFLAAWLATTSGTFDRAQSPAARGPTVRTVSDGTRPYLWRAQEGRQRKRTSNKSVGAFAIAAVVASTTAASTLGTSWDGTRQHRPANRPWPRGPPLHLLA